MKYGYILIVAFTLGCAAEGANGSNAGTDTNTGTDTTTDPNGSHRGPSTTVTETTTTTATQTVISGPEPSLDGGIGPDTTPAIDTTPAPDTTPAIDTTPAADTKPACGGVNQPCCVAGIPTDDVGNLFLTGVADLRTMCGTTGAGPTNFGARLKADSCYCTFCGDRGQPACPGFDQDGNGPNLIWLCRSDTLVVFNGMCTKP